MRNGDALVVGAPAIARPVRATERDALAATANWGADDDPAGPPPYRRFRCRWYWRCLDHAEYMKWTNFSCRWCAVRDEVSEVEYARQNDGAAKLLRVESPES